MNLCDSYTSIVATAISCLMVSYCAVRSSNGTFNLNSPFSSKLRVRVHLKSIHKPGNRYHLSLTGKGRLVSL